MIPTTVRRVLANTPEDINTEIARRTASNVAAYARRGPQEITNRLQQLDAEWDIERLLEANASTVSLIGLTLGFTEDKRWFLLPTLVSAFLLQHAVQGWCPPLYVFRKLGVRTASEINDERVALKILRGDFENISDVDDDMSSHDVATIMQMVRC